MIPGTKVRLTNVKGVRFGVHMLASGASASASTPENLNDGDLECNGYYNIHQDVDTETLTSTSYVDDCNSPAVCSYQSNTYEYAEEYPKIGWQFMGSGDIEHSCIGEYPSIDTYKCSYDELYSFNYENRVPFTIDFDEGGVVESTETDAIGFIHRNC